MISHGQPESDDAAVIAAARQGDGAAFAQLFRRHADAVRTRITRLVGPVAERDDLVQKVFIAFHRALPAYRGDARLSTFLHRIAVNTAFDYLRGRRGTHDHDLHDAEALAEHLSPALEDQVAARTNLARMFALLERLSPKKRIAFILVAVEGCSLAEAAALIGAPEDTVKQRVLHARRHLLAHLGAGDANRAAGRGNVVIRRRSADSDVAQSEELERLCAELGRVEAPFDEITRSRAEARLAAALARQPDGATGACWGGDRPGCVGCSCRRRAGRAHRHAGGRLARRACVPRDVAPVRTLPRRADGHGGSAAAASTMPETLAQPASSLDVPAGWLVRASLGDAIAITLTGPARAWSERENGRTVVHLNQGRLLASLEGGGGRRLEIVSPGAVTDVVGTLFSVEVVGGASRVAVAHGRVQVRAVPDSSGARPPEAREIGGARAG